MKKPNNNPHLTAKERTSISFPTNWLKKNNLLQGEILDFGCGLGFDTDQLQKEGFDIIGYDNYYRPEYPTKRFDTIICNYVLNVLEPEEQAEVLMSVSELLKPTGIAYFTVRRDLKYEGFRTHFVHKMPTYQCNVVLPYKSVFLNENCEIYEYRHFNKTDYKKEYEIVKGCPFCNLNPKVELVCETATGVAFYDGYPAFSAIRHPSPQKARAFLLCPLSGFPSSVRRLLLPLRRSFALFSGSGSTLLQRLLTVRWSLL